VQVTLFSHTFHSTMQCLSYFTIYQYQGNTDSCINNWEVQTKWSWCFSPCQDGAVWIPCSTIDMMPIRYQSMIECKLPDMERNKCMVHILCQPIAISSTCACDIRLIIDHHTWVAEVFTSLALQVGETASNDCLKRTYIWFYTATFRLHLKWAYIRLRLLKMTGGLAYQPRSPYSMFVYMTATPLICENAVTTAQRLEIRTLLKLQ